MTKGTNAEVVGECPKAIGYELFMIRVCGTRELTGQTLQQATPKASWSKPPAKAHNGC